MSRKGDLQELETEVLRCMPADVMHALERRDRREPVVRHLVQSAISRFVSDIDRRTLEVLTAKIMAGTAAVKAVTEARRAVHELSRVDQVLGQQDELHDIRHETARLTEQEKQERLRFRRARRQQRSAERAWLERQLDREDSPKPQVRNKWEALLQAFRGDVTGVANFQAQTELWLDEFHERERARVAEADPLRAEKLGRAYVLVGELRALRDRMLRESWRSPDQDRERRQ